MSERSVEVGRFDIRLLGGIGSARVPSSVVRSLPRESAAF